MRSIGHRVAAILGTVLSLVGCGPADVPREPFESALSCSLAKAEIEELADRFDGTYFDASMNHNGWQGIRRGRRHYNFDFDADGSLARVLVLKPIPDALMFGKLIFDNPEELFGCKSTG